MKTAMQELIDWMEDPTISKNQDKDNCIRKAKQLLEKEKQQIIGAYRHAKNVGYENSDNYYNETYRK